MFTPSAIKTIRGKVDKRCLIDNKRAIEMIQFKNIKQKPSSKSEAKKKKKKKKTVKDQSVQVDQKNDNKKKKKPNTGLNSRNPSANCYLSTKYVFSNLTSLIPINF